MGDGIFFVHSCTDFIGGSRRRGGERKEEKKEEEEGKKKKEEELVVRFPLQRTCDCHHHIMISLVGPFVTASGLCGMCGDYVLLQCPGGGGFGSSLRSFYVFGYGKC